MTMITFSVAELTHRNGTKSRVSVMFPRSPDWACQYLANPDIVSVKIIQGASVARLVEAFPDPLLGECRQGYNARCQRVIDESVERRA
jgi:hypothetical protein